MPTHSGRDVGLGVTWHTQSLCIGSSLRFMALVVTKRPLLIFLKNSSVVDFQYEGKEKKNQDECGQTFKIWLYQEFHLHFVASTNPPQFLARDFLSLKAYKDAGKQVQCISRNRLQNEDKASGKTWRIDRGQATK